MCIYSLLAGLVLMKANQIPPGPGATGDYKLLSGSWELNLGLRRADSVLNDLFHLFYTISLAFYVLGVFTSEQQTLYQLCHLPNLANLASPSLFVLCENFIRYILLNVLCPPAPPRLSLPSSPT